jgi:hypothetical protein
MLMATPYPDYEDVVRESREIASSRANLASYSEIGKSEEGRPIPLLTLTDPAVPTARKSVLLLSGGTDGNEEVGRAVALGMARELVKPQHRVHLQRQVVLVVPVTNPDGCVRDLSDCVGNARGVLSTQVHVTDIPASAEGRAMRGLVDEWIPDAHVDFHGLAGGSMGDYSFLYPTVNRNWSVPILMEVSAEIDRASAAAGFPPSGQPRLWWEPRANLPGWLARNHNTFCMVVEGPENYFSIEDSVLSGVARMLRLMEIGEEVRYFQDHSNYPCDIVSGGRMGAVLPLGSDYTTRRKCRRDISRMILEGVPRLGRETCDHDWTARVSFPVEDAVKTFPHGLVVKATIDRRATIRGVYWQDHKLEESLWTVTPGLGGLVVRAEVPEPPSRGSNMLSIKYEVTFKRHVTRSPEQK